MFLSEFQIECVLKQAEQAYISNRVNKNRIDFFLLALKDNLSNFKLHDNVVCKECNGTGKIKNYIKS